jgi:hypothetical protein
MIATTFSNKTIGTILVVMMLISAAVASYQPAQPQSGVILKGNDTAAVEAAVLAVGGEVTHRLSIIDSIGANLTATQIELLRDHPAINSAFADGIV